GRGGPTGNFILDEFAMSLTPAQGAREQNSLSADAANKTASQTNIYFTRATADWEQEYYRAEHAIDRNPKTGWAIAPQFGKPHFLIAELKEPSGFAGGTKVSFRFDHYHGNSHTVGRIRLSVTTERDPAALWPIPSEIWRIL